MTFDAAAIANLFRTPSVYITGVLVLFIVSQIHRAGADRRQRASDSVPPAFGLEELLLVLAAVAVLLLVAMISLVLHSQPR